MRSLKIWMIVMAGMFLGKSLPAQNQYSFGLKGGMVHSTFKSYDVSGFSTRSAFLTGVFLNIHPGKIMALQPEVLLLQMGADRYNAGLRTNYKINYLDVPLLFKL